MKLKNIKGVSFDLHGTLLLSSDIVAAWNEWGITFYKCMVERGLSISKAEFDQNIDAFFEQPAPNVLDDDLTLFERRVKELSTKLNVDIDSSSLRGIVEEVISAWSRDMFLDPHAHTILRTLQLQFKLALITNWDHSPWIPKVLTNIGLKRYFEIVIISDEVGIRKPDHRIFDLALERMNLQPDEVVHIGDAREDVEGSINAGIQPILIIRDNSSEYDLLDHNIQDQVLIIKQLQDLLTIVL
jgi:HAD superfamily hydrolase (TIGR01509 family)